MPHSIRTYFLIVAAIAIHVAAAEAQRCTGSGMLAVTVETCSGVGEAADAMLFISPNPALNSVEIQNNGAGGVFRICDALGRERLKETLPTGERSRIDIRRWPAGTYWVVWQSKERRVPFRKALLIAH